MNAHTIPGRQPKERKRESLLSEEVVYIEILRKTKNGRTWTVEDSASEEFKDVIMVTFVQKLWLI